MGDQKYHQGNKRSDYDPDPAVGEPARAPYSDQPEHERHQGLVVGQVMPERPSGPERVKSVLLYQRSHDQSAHEHHDRSNNGITI